MNPERVYKLWEEIVIPTTDSVEENLRLLVIFANLCQAEILEEIALAEPVGWRSTLLARARELRGIHPIHNKAKFIAKRENFITGNENHEEAK